MEFFENVLYSESGQGEVFSTDPVEIPGIEGERPLTLYLPPNYLLEPGKRYAIAYLFDGQNLYDRSEWPMGWNLHKILDARAAEGLEVPIVVGIHHGANRDEELCPWPAEKGQTPRGDDLLDWIVSILHPQLCEQLRINDTAESRMIGGSSLGGLLALYAGFRHSDFFGKIMSMLPSLWVGDGAIYDYIAEAAFLNNLDFIRLYIDCGGLEADDEDLDEDQEEFDEAAFGEDLDELEADDDAEENAEDAFEDAGERDEPDDEAEPDDDLDNNYAVLPEEAHTYEDLDEDLEDDSDEDSDSEAEDEWESDPLEDAEYLVDILRAKGFVEGEQFAWVCDPEGEHNEWYWSQRLPLALAYLFDD